MNKEISDKLYRALKLCKTDIEINAEASHFTEGFGPRRLTKEDKLLAVVKDALEAYEREAGDA